MNDTDTSPGFWGRCCGNTARDRRNLNRLLLALLAWSVLFAGGSQLIKREVFSPSVLIWVAAVIPSLAAVWVFKTYADFLRQADELQRSIHLEGLAIGFGGGWLGCAAYRLFEPLGAPAADTGDAVLFMAVAYSVGVLRASWRYR